MCAHTHEQLWYMGLLEWFVLCSVRMDGTSIAETWRRRRTNDSKNQFIQCDSIELFVLNWTYRCLLFFTSFYIALFVVRFGCAQVCLCCTLEKAEHSLFRIELVTITTTTTTTEAAATIAVVGVIASGVHACVCASMRTITEGLIHSTVYMNGRCKESARENCFPANVHI